MRQSSVVLLYTLALVIITASAKADDDHPADCKRALQSNAKKVGGSDSVAGDEDLSAVFDADPTDSLTLSSHQHHLNQLKHETLASSEERRLIQLAQEGNSLALDQLVRSNQKFIHSIAKSMFFHPSSSRVDLVDLVQSGNVGLILAINKFDLSIEGRLSTYARRWIIGEMIDLVAKQNFRTFRLPKDVYQYMKTEVDQARQELLNSNGREPTHREIAGFFADRDSGFHWELAIFLRGPISGDEPVDSSGEEGNEITLFELTPAQPDFGEEVLYQFSIEILSRLSPAGRYYFLAEHFLQATQQEIRAYIRDHFGLSDRERRSLKAQVKRIVREVLALPGQSKPQKRGKDNPLGRDDHELIEVAYGCLNNKEVKLMRAIIDHPDPISQAAINLRLDREAAKSSVRRLKMKLKNNMPKGSWDLFLRRYATSFPLELEAPGAQ